VLCPENAGGGFRMSSLMVDLFDGLIKLSEKQDGFVSTEDLEFFKKHAEQDTSHNLNNESSK